MGITKLLPYKQDYIRKQTTVVLRVRSNCLIDMGLPFEVIRHFLEVDGDGGHTTLLMF